MKAKYIMVIFLNLMGLPIYAQDNCAERLIKANEYYENGKLNEAITIALACSQESASNAQKWQAYRLLAMAYLSNNQQMEARNSVISLLQLNPTYKTSLLKDPAELIKLIKSINIIPKFSLNLAFTVGGNITNPHVLESYNAGNYNKTYQSSSSYQVALLAGYHISNSLSLHAGLQISSKRYSLQYSFANWDFNIKERLAYADIPISVRYAFLGTRKIRPFVEAGFFGGYLLQSQNDFEKKWLTDGSITAITKLDSKERRNNFAAGSLISAGIIGKTRNGHVAVTFTYANSFSNITKISSRYKAENNLYNYYYLDDNLKLNNFSISIGYSMYLNYRIIK